MNWSNVKLIVLRETRDQLRDRRTLFMIVVLPVLLYPLLGMGFFELSQLIGQRDFRVLVLGAPKNVELPPLADRDRFSETLYPSPLLRLTVEPNDSADPKVRRDPAQARREMHSGDYDLVVYFPPNFSEQFASYHQSMLLGVERDPKLDVQVPNVEIYPNLAKESSRTAYDLVYNVLAHWRDLIGQRNLQDSHVSPAAVSPFEIATLDLAQEGQHQAAMWSRILPFLLLIWALTGAFYPAIDLCAGEKERGTLETLLCSPAERIEIVWGKLITVMAFSLATAVLNLASLSVSGSLVVRHIPDLGSPPGLSVVWLLVALVPISALFSAVCLAVAALARSTKEGQHYLMPLVLIVTPLAILPMAPGVELTLGNSLIPLTGMVLVLRTILEGNLADAWPYIAPVLAVTLGCCWLAILGAVKLFDSEGILFREAELWSLRLRLRRAWLERGRLPTGRMAESIATWSRGIATRLFGSQPGTQSTPASRTTTDRATLREAD